MPDADMLVKIAELFEVGVSDLLGGATEEKTASESAPDFSEIAEQLSRINEQLVIKNRRARRVWKTVAAVLISLFALTVLLIVLSATAFTAYRMDGEVTTVEGEVISVQTTKHSIPADE